MKQRVEYEQAERLAKSGVYIGTTLNYQPTIGELIEWIDSNTQEDDMWMCHSMKHCGMWSVTSSVQIEHETELIDALVELAIKIKED